MSIPGLGDVFRFVEFANQIYTYGFTKSHRAASLYNEFGENIKYLATNLGDLQKIIESVSENGISQSADSVYLDSLCDIIGNYQTTLQDCDNLLRDNTKFRWRGDFIHNIVWNFTVASDVKALKDQLSYLNIKIMTILKTLDLHMAHKLSISIFRIHRDLASRIDGARDDILQQFDVLRLEILGLRTGSSNTLTSSSRARAGPFDIPISLEGLFEQQIQDFDIDKSQFPLVRGLDAAVYHINAANTIPADNKESKRERQWLEIAKAFWIINRVRAGKEYISACSFRSSNILERQMNDMGITIESYVKGLEIELLEITKGSDINNFTPDSEVILENFRNNPEIWLKCREEIAPTPSWELEFSEKIMSASLKGPYRGFDQSLHLFRLTEVDLKLVISDVPRETTRSGERNNNNMNVDLQRACYIPLYASSISSSSALNVKFQGDRLAAGSTALSFRKRSELFEFQQAITSYKVWFEALNIQVVSYMSRLLGGTKREYSGRLQLWRAKRLKNSTKDGTSGSPRSSASPETLATSPTAITDGSPTSGPFSGASMSDRSSLKRRDSAITMASQGRRASTMTTSSAFSVAQTRLRGPASTFQTSIVDNDGNFGIVLNKPEPSMLVLFLEQSKRSSASKELSFLAVQLDEEASIDKSACECRRPNNTCTRSVIHRSGGGPLITYRHDAGTEMDVWNLASLGQWQRESLQGSNDRIPWVMVNFGTVGDRVNFEEMFGQLKTILIKEKSWYHKALEDLRV